MAYEVVVSIYETGKDESLLEETVFETDDLAEAREEFDDLTAEYAEEDVWKELTEKIGFTSDIKRLVLHCNELSAPSASLR